MAELPISSGIKTLLTGNPDISGWNIEIGAMPKSPDRIISISDTGGFDPNPKWLIDYPTIQILVRGKIGDYNECFLVGKGIKDALLGLPSQDINDDRWASITMNGDLGYIGRDENDRPLCSMNFQLIVHPQYVADGNRFSLWAPNGGPPP